MTSYERTNENAAFVLLNPDGVLQSKTAPEWTELADALDQVFRSRMTLETPQLNWIERMASNH